MTVIEHTTRWLCPEHPALAVELPERGDRCMDCGGPLAEVDFVIVPAEQLQRAVSTEVLRREISAAEQRGYTNGYQVAKRDAENW